MLSYIKRMFNRNTEEVEVEETVDNYRIVETIDGFVLEHWESFYCWNKKDHTKGWCGIAGPYADIARAKEAHRITLDPKIEYL